MLRTTRSFPNQFPVHIFTAVQRPQPEQRSDIPRLTWAHILPTVSCTAPCSHGTVGRNTLGFYLCSSELGMGPRAGLTIWNTRGVIYN